MRIGTGQADITPGSGVEMSGYVARVQPSTGVHDVLAARCLCLDDRGRRLLWAHTDLIGLEEDFVRRFRAWAGQRHGLRAEEVVVSATHTHSGPATMRLNGCGSYEAQYAQRLFERLQAAADSGLRQSAEAQTVFAEGHCELNMDRRGKPSAHVDRRLAVLAWRKPGGDYAAVLANYPMHNTALGPENRKISGDVAGAAARRLQLALPGRPAVLCTNGACGNLNPYTKTADFALIEEMGQRLAQSVQAALADAKPLGDDALHTASRTARLPCRPLDESAVRQIAAGFRTQLGQARGYCADRQRGVIDAWEAHTLDRARRGTLAAHAQMEVQLVQLGPVRLVCMAAEVFSRMADELRAAAGERTYVVGYANGDIGYLPTPQAFAEGGYEVDSAFIYYLGQPLAPGAFEAARGQAIDLIHASR